VDDDEKLMTVVSNEDFWNKVSSFSLTDEGRRWIYGNAYYSIPLVPYGPADDAVPEQPPQYPPVLRLIKGGKCK
jgi:hypothetical protein